MPTIPTGNLISPGGAQGPAGPQGPQSLGCFIETPTNKTYTLELSSGGAYTITQLAIKTISGTCTAALQRNGTSITGATAVSVSSTLSTVTLSQACVVGDKIDLVISANASAADLCASIRRQ